MVREHIIGSENTFCGQRTHSRVTTAASQMMPQWLAFFGTLLTANLCVRYERVCIYVCVCVYVYKHATTMTQDYVCMYVCVRAYVYTHARAYTHMYTRTHARTHAHTHDHTCMHARTHARARTHTPLQSLSIGGAGRVPNFLGPMMQKIDRV